jgi:hypothetical protein
MSWFRHRLARLGHRDPVLDLDIESAVASIHHHPARRRSRRVDGTHLADRPGIAGEIAAVRRDRDRARAALDLTPAVAARHPVAASAAFSSNISSAAWAGLTDSPADNSLRPVMWSPGRLTESIASRRPPLK